MDFEALHKNSHLHRKSEFCTKSHDPAPSQVFTVVLRVPFAFSGWPVPFAFDVWAMKPFNSGQASGAAIAPT